MKKLRSYVRLLRPKHCLKNFLIFIPLFFGRKLYDIAILQKLCVGFFSLCLVASIVYIINDLNDIDKDRAHPTKRNRPLASGEISKLEAMFLLVFLLVLVLCLSFYLGNLYCFLIIAIYFTINIFYSLGLKNQPIIDVAILASGFVIRILYGSLLSNICISKWLYTVVICGSTYISFGKRLKEILLINNITTDNMSRPVLKKYGYNFLNQNMYMFLNLTYVFYTLWAIDYTTYELYGNKILLSLPIFIVTLMRYNLNVENKPEGDPVEIILKDKVLISLASSLVLYLFSIIYFKIGN